MTGSYAQVVVESLIKRLLKSIFQAVFKETKVKNDILKTVISFSLFILTFLNLSWFYC
jgi:metal-dependent HD superfamily phosphatase/phosphodiesterase